MTPTPLTSSINKPNWFMMKGEAGKLSVETLPSASLTGYRELMAELGGDTEQALRTAGIAASALDKPDNHISWHAVAIALQEGARRLGCADFGMRLAERQDALRLSGSLEQLYLNAPSLFEALNWTVTHGGAYTSAIRNTIRWDADLRLYVESFHFADHGILRFEQLVELLLLLSQNAITDLTGGLHRAREIWFSHRPVSPVAHYRAKFGVPVRFSQEIDALLYTEESMHARAIDADKEVFNAQRESLAAQFLPSVRRFEDLVRETIEKLLLDNRCSRREVASLLHTSSSSLHRRLQAVGTSFEMLRDEARKAQALRYLLSTDMRLTDISERLGYAEPSILSRSFRRWFNISPREMRRSRAVQSMAGQMRPSPDLGRDVK